MNKDVKEKDPNDEELKEDADEITQQDLIQKYNDYLE